mgnify:CR=1 FL=1
MRKTKVLLQRILSILMIAIISCMIVNRAVFMHTHIMANGTVVTHAHPYDKSDHSPFKSHKHSNSELLFLQQLKDFLPILAFVFTALLIVKLSSFRNPEIHAPSLLLDRIYTGRAPPVL